MKEEYVLVDFENVQPTFDELISLVSAPTEVWLFHGPYQLAAAEKMTAENSRVTRVPRSGKGRNALDFHLSFYLGHMACKHPNAQLVIVANDKGYDPMLEHTKMLGFDVKRVGWNEKKVAPAKKTAAKSMAAAKKVKSPVVPVVIGNELSANAPAVVVKPSKKAAPKKAVAKKIVSKKIIPKKKTVAEAAKKKPAAIKQGSQKSSPAKAAVVSQKAVPIDAKELQRVVTGLAKMNDKKPAKFKSLEKHLRSFLGKDGSADRVSLLIEKLEQRGVFTVVGDLVLYA